MPFLKQMEGFLVKRRFWSLPRHRRMTWLQERPHLDVQQWLSSLDLLEYADCFKHANGVEELLDLDEADIKSMGVKNGAHRAKIVSSLVFLRSKYDKFTGYRSFRCEVSKDKSPRSHHWQHSTSSDNLFICQTKSDFSSVRCGMEPVFDPNASPRQLRKALEWELSLDSQDLRSHAWYHGSISRARAEELIAQDGDFLIRDCMSQPGDYVLTCRSKGLALHFVINKIVIQPNTVYERIQFLLEDDSYDTVPDLVTCYVGSGKVISLSSSARISRPINRSMPLSYYASRYGAGCRSESDFGSRTASPMPSLSSVGSSKTTPVHSPHGTPPGSPTFKRRTTPLPPLPEKYRGSSVKGDYGSTDSNSPSLYPMVSSLTSVQLEDNSPYPNDVRYSVASTLCRRQNLIRAGSEPMLSPRMQRKNSCGSQWSTSAVPVVDNSGSVNAHDTMQSVHDTPPPKPSRTPSLKYSRRPYVAMNHVRESSWPDPISPSVAMVEHFNLNCGANNNESDSGNGSGDSIHSADMLVSSCMTLGSVKRRPVGGRERQRRPCSDTRFSFLDRNSGASNDGANSEVDSAFGEEPTLTLPNLDPVSMFDLGSNSATATAVALLLSSVENKPLDMKALRKVHSVLIECGPRVLAAHLTRVDLDLLKVGSDVDLGLGIFNGLELLTLPHGHQLRLDLIERIECLKLFVAITILTCLNETERANMLRKWIEIAVDTKTALGNLYSFTGIMLGLGIPQVQRLKLSWNSLRLSCTDIAFTYETKLRPILKSMNECSNPQAPNTTIPHLLPVILAIEKSFEELVAPHDDEVESYTIQSSQGALPCIKCSFPWEQSSTDYGTFLLFSHLECGRNFVLQSGTFRRNSEIVLENVKYEELLLAMFRTEFHLKFLWGSKGAFVCSSERHPKFEQVLSVMSERCEPE